MWNLVLAWIARRVLGGQLYFLCFCFSTADNVPDTAGPRPVAPFEWLAE